MSKTFPNLNTKRPRAHSRGLTVLVCFQLSIWTVFAIFCRAVFTTRKPLLSSSFSWRTASRIFACAAIAFVRFSVIASLSSTGSRSSASAILMGRSHVRVPSRSVENSILIASTPMCQVPDNNDTHLYKSQFLEKYKAECRKAVHEGTALLPVGALVNGWRLVFEQSRWSRIDLQDRMPDRSFELLHLVRCRARMVGRVNMLVFATSRPVAVRALMIPVVLNEVSLQIECSSDFIRDLGLCPLLAHGVREAHEPEPEQSAQSSLIDIQTKPP